MDGNSILKLIEQCGRTAYKSEQNIQDGSEKKFVAGLIKRGHESVLEHFNITVKFVTDRGISHEIVRHRLASYTQESTRYCNYGNDKFGNEISVICPSSLKTAQRVIWRKQMKDAEKAYFTLLNAGVKPQDARSVLPTCLKTEIVMTTNLREWRHVIKQRIAKDAHPDIRILFKDLLKQFKEAIPVVFNDIEVDE